MIVLHTLDEAIGRYTNPVIAVGNFDGVHLGHRVIIDEALSRATTRGKDCIILTFEPHPQLIVGHQNTGFILSPLDEKIRLLSEHPIACVLVLPFDKAFAETEPESFVERVYVNGLHISELVVGFSHAFGRYGKGNSGLLKTLGTDLGFSVHVMPPHQMGDKLIGSSLIRKMLSDGEIQLATDLLGHAYTVAGVVVPGDGRGRQLEFPTANLELHDKHQLLPKHGVYAVRVDIGESQHRGVMNIGIRPTFGSDEERCEIHILDFNHDLYGSPIKFSVIQRIRDEKRFSDIGALKDQISMDVDKAREILS